MRLHGAWTAIVTPMNPNLSLDRQGLKKNAEFQISQGITGVVPVGTTGESPTVTWEEHNEIIDMVLSWCKGRCGVLPGTGSNSTHEAIESTRHAVESGAQAVLMVDCYYNGPSSQELREQYYAAVADEFPDVTIVPYVIPGRSGTALGVEDLAILSAAHPNVSAVKEATGDLQRMARTRTLLGDDFSIMSGDDDVTYDMLTDRAIRANGVISVASNIAPRAVKDMVASALSGDTARSEKIRNALAPLLGVVTVKVDNPRVLPTGETFTVNDRYRNPVPVKALMAGLGMPSGPCRRPLGKMSKAGVEVVRTAAQDVWDRDPEILQPIADFFAVDIRARLADDSIWNALVA